MRTSLEWLRSRVSGAVLTPEDAGYAEASAAFNTAVTHAPELVVLAESAGDIAEAIRFAREHGLPVSIQGTGHGAHAPIGTGLLIATQRLTSVHVDAHARVATLDAGVRWSQVIEAAAVHGLMPVAGASTSVGVVGYLLGGGLGPLARSHGFSSDYVQGFTVVSGTGELLEATADAHPDLFWALRGGKSGLGVVARVRLRLVALRTFYAGALWFEEAHVERVLRGWLEWTATASPHVTTSAALLSFPELDVIPAGLRGRRLLSLRFVHAGPDVSAEGERLARPLRSLAPVYLDDLRERPASELARVHGDPEQPGPAWVDGLMLGHVDQGFAGALLEHAGPRAGSPFVAVEVRHLGAATAEDVPGGSAVGGRGAGFALGLVAVAPGLFASVAPVGAARLMEALAPWSVRETNINFLGRVRSPAHLARAWSPGTFAQLERVRRRYDPHRTFAPAHFP